MAKYRCHLLDGEGIATIRVVECADDASAVLEADRILAASPYAAIEVWYRQHKISILSRKPSSNQADRDFAFMLSSGASRKIQGPGSPT
jgi:hypothetical protein